VTNLVDQTGAATMSWALNNALPTKITGTDPKSDAMKMAVHCIELAYETLTASTES
jgi:hypothetical protein